MRTLEFRCTATKFSLPKEVNTEHLKQMDKLLSGHLKQNVLIVSNHNFHSHHTTIMCLNFYNPVWSPTAIINS